jgi:hypothetical protein
MARAQRRKAGDRPQRHVERVPMIVSSAPSVRHAGRAPHGLATGAGAAAAPCGEGELSR